jgi:hypothetical protein
MATKREKGVLRTRDGRPNPRPRLNPKNGPPVYFQTEGGTIPLEKIEAAVREVLAARGALAIKK